MKWTFAEFFAGIGLMRLGLEREGWSLAFANDISPEKHEMYVGNFPDSHEHYKVADIHTLDAVDIPTVNLATASFPCNDLSLAGARTGLKGRHSSAYWGFVALLERLGRRRPPVVLLENVPGFLTSRGGADFQEALLALNGLGYAVDALLVDAQRFVPQSRLRLFVVGVNESQKETYALRESSPFYGSDVRPPALADFIFAHPEISWHIRPLPRLPERAMDLTDILEDLPDDSEFWWNEQRCIYLLNQMSEKHAKQLEIMQKARNASFGTIFRRVRNGKSMAELRTDGIAGCLRTPRGGSGRQIVVQAGFGKVRARLLTPRECARLMGADEFSIRVSLNQALFGFGDAVCVPVISWIAHHYLNPLIREISGWSTSKVLTGSRDGDMRKRSVG